MNNDRYESFIKANLGKAVEREDPTNVDQCMDYAFAFCDDVLGVDRATIRHLYAYQVFTQPYDLTKQYFDIIPNSPTFTPQKGDLGVFGTAVGVAGHICVCSGNNDGLNKFQSTDQNWSGHKYVEYIWHDYTGFLGVLRFKGHDDSASNYYKGYDLTNKDSMKVAVDVLVKYQQGAIIDKDKCPVTLPPSYSSQKDQIKKALDQIPG